MKPSSRSEHTECWCDPPLELRENLGLGQAIGNCDGFLDRTNRNVISVGISEREFLGLSVRIHVRLLFEPGDK